MQLVYICVCQLPQDRFFRHASCPVRPLDASFTLNAHASIRQQVPCTWDAGRSDCSLHSAPSSLHCPSVTMRFAPCKLLQHFYAAPYTMCHTGTRHHAYAMRSDLASASLCRAMNTCALPVPCCDHTAACSPHPEACMTHCLTVHIHAQSEHTNSKHRTRPSGNGLGICLPKSGCLTV